MEFPFERQVPHPFLRYRGDLRVHNPDWSNASVGREAPNRPRRASSRDWTRESEIPFSRADLFETKANSGNDLEKPFEGILGPRGDFYQVEGVVISTNPQTPTPNSESPARLLEAFQSSREGFAFEGGLRRPMLDGLQSTRPADHPIRRLAVAALGKLSVIV